MRVFISWSGERSKSIAEALPKWLRLFFHTLEPWMSRHNIEKGTRWRLKLAEELESTNYGILCITPGHENAPWILFEAGALSKALEDSRVVPFLIDVDYSDLPDPLKEFNPTIANRDDTRLLLTSLRKAVMASGEVSPSDTEINELFNKLWPDLEKALMPPTVTQEPLGSEIRTGESASPDPTEPTATVLTDASSLATSAASDPWLDMFRAHAIKDLVKVKEAYERLKKVGGRDEDQRIVDESVFHYFSFSLGDASALERLRELIEDKKGGGAPTYWAGQCYELSESYSKAIELYEIAARRAITPSLRADAQVSRALCMSKSGERAEAIEYLLDVIPETTGNKAHLYVTLSVLYKMSGQLKLAAVCAERALEEEPTDPDIRFKAAYAYSSEESEFSALSLLHYKTILQFQQDSYAAWNNLGVQYDLLDAKGLSVRAYKKASELKNTLANANLAYRYMGAGFFEEARAVLNEAQKEPHVHKNVGSAFSTIIELQEKESEKLDETLIAAREQQNFITAFAASFFEAKGINPAFGGMWKSDDGTVVKVTQADVKVNGEFSKSYTEYQLSGIIRNRGTYFTLLKKTYSAFSEAGYGYMYLSKDGQHLYVMLIENNQHQILKLEAILPAEPEDAQGA